MIDLSGRSVPVLTLAYGLLVVLAVVQADSAAAADSEGQQSAAGRVCGHKFEPGPIVDNHYRQPTPAEFEARMRELRALCQESAGSRAPARDLSCAGASLPRRRLIRHASYPRYISAMC